MRVTIDDLLKFVVQNDGSDLIIKAESPPLVRIHGDLRQMKIEPFTAEESKEIVYSILSEAQKKRFEEDLELDLSYEIADLARFRVNVLQQREAVGTCIRVIPMHISTMEEL